MIEHVVTRILEAGGHDLLEILAKDATLVPIPRSAPPPPRQKNYLWVPLRICDALVAAGMGCSALTCLERVRAIAKSAGAAPGKRPALEIHLDSMSVVPPVVRPAKVVLVDDVVTRGTTLLASACLVREALPGTDVACFALVRTRGLVPEVERIVDPVVGVIRLNAKDEAERRP